MQPPPGVAHPPAPCYTIPMPARKLRQRLRKHVVAAVIGEVLPPGGTIKRRRIPGAVGTARVSEDGHIERHHAHPAKPPYPETLKDLIARQTRAFTTNPIRYIQDNLQPVVDAQLAIGRDTTHPRAVAAGTNLMHYAMGRPASRIEREDTITVVIKRPGAVTKAVDAKALKPKEGGRS